MSIADNVRQTFCTQLRVCATFLIWFLHTWNFAGFGDVKISFYFFANNSKSKHSKAYVASRYLYKCGHCAFIILLYQDSLYDFRKPRYKFPLGPKWQRAGKIGLLDFSPLDWNCQLFWWSMGLWRTFLHREMLVVNLLLDCRTYLVHMLP